MMLIRKAFLMGLVAICLGILFLTFPATASDIAAAAPPQKAPPPKAAKKEEKLEFSGLSLQGQLKKPDLSYIYKRRGIRSERIVNIPENFNEEIIQGAGRF